MSEALPIATSRVRAVPDAPEIGVVNPIHGARAEAYGYREGIVSGIVTYGWASAAIIDALGEGWLDRGWAEVRFRRPVYGDDLLTTRIFPGEGGTCRFEQCNAQGEAVTAGRVGLGDAPWLAEIEVPGIEEGVPAIPDPPLVDLERLPVGSDYRPMCVDTGAEVARSWARHRAHDLHPRYLEGPVPRLHPSWLAGQVTPLLLHSQRYAAGIHVASRIQHLAPARAGDRATVSGRWRESYERKGKRYAVSDAVIRDRGGREWVRVRQTSIFLPPLEDDAPPVS